MRRLISVLAVPLCLVPAGCGQRLRPAAATGKGPQVGWVIMSGDPENPNHDFVCQSNPRSECIVPTSRPNATVMAALYFYYHPAMTETRYSGSIQIGFFAGSPASNVLRPNFTVKPQGSVGNQSVV